MLEHLPIFILFLIILKIEIYNAKSPDYYMLLKVETG